MGTEVTTVTPDTVMDTDTVWDTADTMVDTTVWDTVDTTDTDTTTARGRLKPPLRPPLRPRLMPLLTTMVDTTAADTDTDMVDTTTVDTTAVDTDTVTDTDIMVKFLLKLQLLSHISSPMIELSINQKTTAPPPYINPEKREKYLDQQKKFHFFKKHLVCTVPTMVSNYPYVI